MKKKEILNAIKCRVTNKFYVERRKKKITNENDTALRVKVRIKEWSGI